MTFVGHVFRKGVICKDLLIGTVYGKRRKGRPKPGIVITFENLVGIRALLIYIDQHRTEKHGEPRLLS